MGDKNTGRIAGDASSTLDSRLSKVETLQRQQLEDLNCLRWLLMELHLAMLLHTVRSNRVALACVDTPTKERQEALLSLDQRENKIQGEIDKMILERPDIDFHIFSKEI